MRKYSNGKLVVYIVLHQDPTYTGFLAGVDFYNGRGSTSSPEDVARLVELGCTAEDPRAQADAEALSKCERERQAEQAAARSAQDKIERSPGYDPRKRPGR
ncbi:MAG: hypothetical protein IMZ46_05680 [Acidobacteria bacterium]|nr:hypothetical protein [Acidobacteriota bacterium]